MSTISLTNIIANSSISSSVVNAIFAEIEEFFNGTTASADMTITGGSTANLFKTGVDGTTVAASGSFTVGTSNDAAFLYDGSKPVIIAVSALTNSVQNFSLTHTTTGTPAAGIGTGLEFITETSASNNEIGSILESVTTDATATSEDFDLVVKLMTAGSGAAEIARFQSDGKLDLVSGAEYQIAGTDVLSATVLGSGVLASSLTSVGTLTALNIASGADYKINSTSVLSATVLGSGVVTSSLTTVAALNSGSITSGFGSIDNGSSTITTTGAITGGNLIVDNVSVNTNLVYIDSSVDAAGNGFRLDSTGGAIYQVYWDNDTTCNIDLVGSGDKVLDINNSGSGDVTLNVTGDLKATNFIGASGYTVLLTISSGAITATGSAHEINTEGSSSTDDLDTINGGSAGDFLLIIPNSSARTVVVKDGTGNLSLAGDFSMDGSADSMFLINNGSGWTEISRSNNGS